MIARIFPLLAFLLAPTAPATAERAPVSTPLARASASLDGKRQCVPFTWLPGGAGSPRGGIAVPVRINGRTLPLQLDTGADATSLYGRFPVQRGWATADAETFRAMSFEVARTMLDRPLIYRNADMADDPSVRGTLGLPALAGRVAVIDYPGRRFCLFAEADVPAALEAATFVRAMLRNAKLHVPVRTGGFASDTVVFDTGSSEIPLLVDLTARVRFGMIH